MDELHRKHNIQTSEQEYLRRSTSSTTTHFILGMPKKDINIDNCKGT